MLVASGHVRVLTVLPVNVPVSENSEGCYVYLLAAQITIGERL